MELPHPKPLDRATIEAWLRRQIAALEAGDISRLRVGLHPDISFTWPAARWQGRHQVQAALEQYLAALTAIRFHLCHLLIDAAHHIAAVEWLCRYTEGDKNNCQEILGGATLEFDQGGKLHDCRIYLDPVRSQGSVCLDAPWPDPGWTPSRNPGPPPSRAVAEQLIQANARAWSSHDVGQLSRIIHDEICICPPWDYQVGRANVEKGAQIYFANYQDTKVTPHRFIIDPDQPYFGVCEQTFACTNPETGRRGEDSDFVFFEIAQGKLRYWRTYFDTANSIQVVEKTAGFLQTYRRTN